MSISYSGTFTRSGGIVAAIGKQMKLVNLKPLKSINIKFDPFHENAQQTRSFLFCLTSPKILATNVQCNLKTNIVCDRSEPIITFNLESGEKVILKCGNLNNLEILELCNKYVSSKVPPAPKDIQTPNIIKKMKTTKR